MKTADQQFIDWQSDIFGFGYGSGEYPIMVGLKTFMDSINEYGGVYSYVRLEQKLGALATWLLINTLAHADIIEYGTSTRFGWLTTKGDKLSAYIKDKTAEQLINIIFDGRSECTSTYCNCVTPSTPIKCPNNSLF